MSEPILETLDKGVGVDLVIGQGVGGLGWPGIEMRYLAVNEASFGLTARMIHNARSIRHAENNDNCFRQAITLKTPVPRSVSVIGSG